ncbi:HAD-IIIA family hydrolase [Polynucleobacter sp. AP-Feld-500C-C5]|uniref:D-glycero-alpha-D-manno-heptose-1,7-bisphosphate 7-phosphatase n=1 Tax=Polynucleobacter sp. AP-Feld-500C-C5 TaxID=2576924 RepID=UPI001C0D12C6|nr:HAD family hydrolase [Polynucleobacter sp. AP-Feld-500C-C5]MBU3632862.1 HAD family hydrolase [Polynucleobacter sp. AP-Feld-500C-C5]
MNARAVFLDRDGVINASIVREGKPYPPNSLNDFTYLPGAVEGIKRLRQAGYLIIVVTNQPDVATGLQKKATVELMHAQLYKDKLCDDIKVCYHIDKDLCDCRKPKPGMLLQAAFEWGIELTTSFMVGDRWRDVEAGNAAGCSSYFIDYQYQEREPTGPFKRVRSLEEASQCILNEN